LLNQIQLISTVSHSLKTLRPSQLNSNSLIAMDSLSRHALLLFSIFSLLRGPFVSADRSPGCYGHTVKPVEWNATAGDIKIFKVNGRQVRVTIPPTFNSTNPAPMMIAFHDKDQAMENLEYEGAFMDGGVNNDIIMVYPSPENVSHGLLVAL
jgi:hypothetical protein